MAPPAPIYRVVLDASVLYPASLRDVLLRCAEKELYRLQLSGPGGRGSWLQRRAGLRARTRLQPVAAPTTSDDGDGAVIVVIVALRL